MVDIQLGLLGWAAKTGDRYTDDWSKIAGQPGQAVRLAKEAIGLLPAHLADDVRGLLADLDSVRQERHRLAHSVFILDPESDSPSHPWVLKSPRGLETALLTADVGARLVSDLNRASRRAGDLRLAIAQHLQVEGAQAAIQEDASQ